MSDNYPDWAQSEILPNGWQIAVVLGGNGVNTPHVPVGVMLLGEHFTPLRNISVSSLVEMEGVKIQFRQLALQA